MSGVMNRGRGFGPRPQVRAQLSLLDRLIDEAPEQNQDAPLSAADHLAILRRSVARDIEMLLNARRRWRSWPEALRELDQSPVAYGIPDCTAGSFHDKRAKETLRQQIEDTLARFEPRFASVKVSLKENSAMDATLRLHIEALLHADPAPEPVAFDTQLDATTATLKVQTADV